MVDLFSWYFHVIRVFCGVCFRILTHGKPFTLCLCYCFPKIAFSNSFRMTTSFFGLSVKNVLVQVTLTLTIFVEH